MYEHLSQSVPHHLYYTLPKALVLRGTLLAPLLLAISLSTVIFHTYGVVICLLLLNVDGTGLINVGSAT